MVDGWWGHGPPPSERWPGVTIPIDDCGGRYRFDVESADRVCAFFPRYCSHGKGAFAGKPFEPLDYQLQLILRPIFGWVQNTPEGLRRFRKSYIQIPKKNGKTQLIAGLALYMLLCDREPGAEVYVAAADREQARVLFNAAKSMVEANPQLAKRCIVTRNKIEKWGDPDSFFQVLSAEAATKHGPNIHCLIVDELHVQHDRDLLETLTRGIIARRQPLILEITTAGDDDESICFEEYDYARRVLSGTIEDERHLPVIFEATAKDDWLDPAVWQKVNPGLGITISREQFEGFAVEAKNEPRKRNDFMRYHLNRWVNQAESWIPVDWWDACDEPIPSDEVLRQYQCANGTDMAQKIDLAANVTLFRLPLAEHEPAVSPVEIVTEDDETGTIVKRSVDLNYRLVILPTFWLPKDTLKARVDQDQVRYDIYEAEGQLEVTEGAIIDEQAIVRHVMDKGAKSGMVYRFPMLRQGQFGYDPAFATSVALQLAALGLTTVEVLQNYKHLCEACQVFEALVKARRVIHGGHRLLRWNVENVAVKTDDAGRIRPVKPKKATRRIDGVVATLIALSRLIAMPPLPARVRRAPKVWTPDGFVPAGGSDGAESRDGARV